LAPAAPAAPVVIGKGTLDAPVSVTTTGPAAFSVRTVVVPPGGSTGWHTHAGTEMSIVTSGAVTLVRAGACAPVTHEAGEAVFIPDGIPHLARNDGSVPAEIVVTYLLAGGAPDRADAPAAC
ncbi:MAG: cupin domain-containing protein, partial [Pseudonocardia sp.]